MIVSSDTIIYYQIPTLITLMTKSLVLIVSGFIYLWKNFQSKNISICIIETKIILHLESFFETHYLVSINTKTI
jgi:hypothetical protein